MINANAAFISSRLKRTDRMETEYTIYLAIVISNIQTAIESGLYEARLRTPIYDELIPRITKELEQKGYFVVIGRWRDEGITISWNKETDYF